MNENKVKTLKDAVSEIERWVKSLESNVTDLQEEIHGSHTLDENSEEPNDVTLQGRLTRVADSLRVLNNQLTKTNNVIGTYDDDNEGIMKNKDSFSLGDSAANKPYFNRTTS